MRIYSNLSLQVLGGKKRNYYYDEYFNFSSEGISKNEDVIIFLLHNVKPLKEKSFLLMFVNSLLVNDVKIWVLSDSKLGIESPIVEFILLDRYFTLEDISYRTLKKYQFPFRDMGMRKLNTLISFVERSTSAPSLKVICVDLDKTLWPGIIGESDEEYSDFNQDSFFLYYRLQALLLNLKMHGVLLALITKNNIQDVEHFFAKNKSMPLSLSDFIVLKANWTDKHQNIAELADELSLGLDTFMYLDDSDLECTLTAHQLPIVEVIQVPEGRLELNLWLETFGYHPRIVAKLNSRLVDKTSEYRYEFQRRNLLDGDMSQEVNHDFGSRAFDLLQVSLNYEKKDESRLSEMSEKTNQFNFNKRILTVDEILSLELSGHKFVCCEASDSFGEYGIIGYAHICNNGILQNFVLSCRALGRGIERKFFDHLLTDHAITQVNYHKTDKNVPAMKFLKEYIVTLTTVRCYSRDF